MTPLSFRGLLAAVCWCLVVPLPPVLGQERGQDSFSLVGRSRISAIYDIEAVPPHAYALERGAIRVLDVHDPGAVLEVGTLEFHQPRRRTELNYPFLYLTGFGAPLAVVDISDPTDPTWVGESPDLRTRGGLPISEGVGYHLTKPSGGPDLMGTGPLILQLLDVGENPASPRILSTLALDVVAVGDFGAMALDNTRVFILVPTPEGERQSRLIVVDATVPSAPRLERSVRVPSDRQFRDIAVQGEILYLLGNAPDWGLAVYSWRNLGELELLGEATDSRLWAGIDQIVHGDALYATYKGAIDLVTFDISNPRAPRLAKTHSFGGDASGLGMTLVEGRLYVSGDAGPSPIFDVSEPLDPLLLGNWQYDGGWAGDVVLSGDLALVESYGSLYLIDISDPYAPWRLGRRIHPWPPGFLSAVGGDGRLVVTAQAEGTAQVLDLTHPTEPRVTGRFRPRGMAQSILMADGYAYLGYRGIELDKPMLSEEFGVPALNDEGGIEVIDLNQPEEPTSAATLELGRPVTDLAMAGGRLFAAEADGGLSIIDVREPGRLNLLGRLEGGSAIPGTPSRSALVALGRGGQIAYVAHEGPLTEDTVGIGTLSVVDIGNDTQPRLVGTVEFPRRGDNQVSVSGCGEQAILSTGALGEFLIVDAGEPDNPEVVFRQPMRSYLSHSVGHFSFDGEYLYIGAGEDGLLVFQLPGALNCGFSGEDGKD